MATDTAHVLWGYGSAAHDYSNFAPSLALFGLGLVLFTAHYLVLRGFYALEQNRRVFGIQCAIAVTNIAAAIVLTHGAPAAQTAPRLVLAYACSYAIGAAVSYTLLARTVGGLAGRRLVRFLVRLAVAVGLSAAVAWGLRELMTRLVPGTATWHAVLDLAVVGLAFLATYFALARVLRISEVNDVTGLITRRLRGRR
jgi:putative peptidoglycan lipid II flippase